MELLTFTDYLRESNYNALKTKPELELIPLCRSYLFTSPTYTVQVKLTQALYRAFN